MAMAIMATGLSDHGLHPFFKPKRDASDNVITAGEHDESPRKRQRTISPETGSTDPLSNKAKAITNTDCASECQCKPTNHPNIHPFEAALHEEPNPESEHDKGLEAHAIVPASSKPIADPVSNAIEPKKLNASTSPQKAPESPPRRIMRVRSDGKLASPKVKPTKEEVLVPEASLPARTSQQLSDKSTSRKTLKLNRDGRLGSPTSLLSADARAVKKKRGRLRSTIHPKSCYLVVLTYGSDTSSRITFGQQIQTILSSLPKRATMLPAERLEPLKPTHPFFLGGIGKPEAEKNPDVAKTHSSSATSQAAAEAQRSKLGTPRRARVTSKPPLLIENHIVSPSKIFPTFGTDHAKVTRFPGAREPAWPSNDMLHIKGNDEPFEHLCSHTMLRTVNTRGRKLKDLVLSVPAELSVLAPYAKLTHSHRSNKQLMQKMLSRESRQLRRPSRQIMKGLELQAEVRTQLREVSSQVPVVVKETHCMANPGPLHKSHPALRRLHDQIPMTRTAFDRFECEAQEWTHKYAPKLAEEVLQHGGEALILRDWLRCLKVSSTSFRQGMSQAGKSILSPFVRDNNKSRRKRKRRSDELDGFVVSSDEDSNEMQDVVGSDNLDGSIPTSRRSIVRSGAVTGARAPTESVANAIVLSGPHGCGKTAAVFAAAKELGFEIFEINAGSRRSGKDILDRVGDMTRNHLVRPQNEEVQKVNDENTTHCNALDEKLQADIDSGRQGTMKNFFSAKTSEKPKGASVKASIKKTSPKKRNTKATSKSGPEEKPAKSQNQRQSLILLEEVDILFEEDKLFWATVLDLIRNSRRPVILTCSDENLLPLEEMSLHAILRFGAPPERLATDYLLLVAANEGHLLLREPVAALYRAKAFDLRASLTELQFFCQMGIGDDKGGLQWMLIDEHSSPKRTDFGSLRVVSKSTYCTGMGWLGGEMPDCGISDDFLAREELYGQLWQEWGMAPGVNVLSIQENASVAGARSLDRLQQLQQIDESCAALSAAHTYPASVVRDELSRKLGTTSPKTSDTALQNFVEGIPLLHADIATDHTNLSDSLALALYLSAFEHDNRYLGSNELASKLIKDIPSHVQETGLHTKQGANFHADLFGSLARESRPSLVMSKGPSISNFDGPLRTIAEDIAPYVRSIVSFDIRLEEQRRQLSSLLAYPGAEGRPRTTRASRAALEGGDKASTRRERWFPESSNFDTILHTGGKHWQEVLTDFMARSRPHDDDDDDECSHLSQAYDAGSAENAEEC